MKQIIGFMAVMAAGVVFAQAQSTPESIPGAAAVDSGAFVEAGKGSDGWKLLIGADYRFPFKTKMQMRTDRYDAAYPPFVPPQNMFRSRDEVLADIGNGDASDERRDYDNGYVAEDSAGGGYTWNWEADSTDQHDPAAETLTFDSFYGVTEAQIGARAADPVDDRTGMAGVSFDLSRDFWRSEDGRFSLAGSAGASYFPERSLLSARQSFAAGTYRSEVWRISDVYDVGNWGGNLPDVTVGGGYSGPNALLPFSPSDRSEGLYETLADETFDGGAWVKSEMWLVEGRLCLMPEWRLSERFSLLGNIGVAFGYARISSRSGSWMTQNTATAARAGSSRDDAFIVQAILGVGARYAFNDRIGLSLTGEARVPNKSVDITADPYEGEVELGTWSVGARIEYCF